MDCLRPKAYAHCLTKALISVASALTNKREAAVAGAGWATGTGAPRGVLRLRMQGRDCASKMLTNSQWLFVLASFAGASSAVRHAGSQGNALTANV
jgi:Trk-type K+ transport system membrane component